MLKTDEIKLAESQSIRRRILESLGIAGPVGLNEESLMMILTNAGYVLLPTELRNHLAYLDDLRAIEIVDRDRATWAAKIKPYGVDIVEYAVKAPAGIAKG